MSSLRFIKPLLIKGLPPEAAVEWKGLSVGLESMFPYYIGDIAEEQPRTWDEEIKTYLCDGPFAHDPTVFATEMMNNYLWISYHSLVEACKYSQPPRPNILSWLEGKEGKRFQHFRVSLEVAEYLP